MSDCLGKVSRVQRYLPASEGRTWAGGGEQKVTAPGTGEFPNPNSFVNRASKNIYTPLLVINNGHLFNVECPVGGVVVVDGDPLVPREGRVPDRQQVHRARPLHRP